MATYKEYRLIAFKVDKKTGKLNIDKKELTERKEVALPDAVAERNNAKAAYTRLFYEKAQAEKGQTNQKTGGDK